MKKIALLILFTGFTFAFAQIPKPQKNTYVNDFAKVLTEAQLTALNLDISQIEKDADVQLAIVLVNKIPAAYEIDDYALLIGRKWHVGNRKRGLVYVAAIDQHKQRLEVATALQTILTHDKSAAILEAIKPHFKAGDYYTGLQTLITQLGNELAPPASAEAAAPPVAEIPAPAPTPQPNDSPSGIAVFLGVLLIVVLPIILIVRSVRRRQRLRNAQAYFESQHPGVNYPPGHPNYNPGYPNQGSSGIGNVLGGLAAGAALGYAARALEDNFDGQQNNGNYDPNFIPDTNNYPDQTDNSSNDNSSDSSGGWGNWGSDSSSSDSSSDDSGFSGGEDSSSSDSGSSSDW